LCRRISLFVALSLILKLERWKRVYDH
jgi:hypothetical protein